MNTFIPVWILGGPFLGIILLSLVFKGQSAMGGSAPRLVRGRSESAYSYAGDKSAPLSNAIHADAPRRLV